MIFGGRFASGGAFFTGRFAPNSSPLARYSLGGQAPAVIADPVAGVYGLGGRSVTFDELFTFSRLSAAWKLNALGHWVKVLAGEPRTGHHVWKDGKLVPAGLAVCSEVRTNLVRFSEALDESAHWEPSNAVVVEPAGELSGIPAFRLTDANTSGYAQINQTGVTHEGGVHVFRMLVAKDQNPTSQFSIRLVYSVDGVGIFSGMSLKVNTGSPVSSWNPNILERKVEDLGDHWMVWFAVDLTGAGAVTVQLFPAHNNTSGGGGAERVGSHVCTAVHFHPGRYPQDYIKTEAAPVSTASEGLQPDPVKLAKAVGVFGPELINNENWVDTSDAGGSASVLGDTLTLDNVTGTARIFNYVPLEAGELYLLENTSSGDQVGTYQGPAIPLGTTLPGPTGRLFVADPGGDSLSYRNFTAGTTGQVSGVSLRKVTMPDALTLVMKGTMTYEDDNGPVPARPCTWELNAGNRIATALSIEGGETGRMWFNTTSGGVSTSVSSAIDAYSPGVDVPFSLALVLTATEIEGFCNGVSTGKTTHGGMPNLLATPMELFTTGTGTIEHFAIYAGNPGSAALQEATA